MESVMVENKFKPSELVDLYCKTIEKSESTANRAIKDLTKMKFFKKLEDGKYTLFKKKSDVDDQATNN